MRGHKQAWLAPAVRSLATRTWMCRYSSRNRMQCPLRQRHLASCRAHRAGIPDQQKPEVDGVQRIGTTYASLAVSPPHSPRRSTQASAWAATCGARQSPNPTTPAPGSSAGARSKCSSRDPRLVGLLHHTGANHVYTWDFRLYNDDGWSTDRAPALPAWATSAASSSMVRDRIPWTSASHT
jgi:hypothetical protein